MARMTAYHNDLIRFPHEQNSNPPLHGSGGPLSSSFTSYLSSGSANNALVSTGERSNRGGSGTHHPWNCQACTYKNSKPEFLTCEMCGQARPNSSGENSVNSNNNNDAPEEQSFTITVSVAPEEEAWVNDHMDVLVCEQQKLLDSFARERTLQQLRSIINETQSINLLTVHDSSTGGALNALILEQEKLLDEIRRDERNDFLPGETTPLPPQRGHAESPSSSAEGCWISFYKETNGCSRGSIISDVTMPADLVPQAQVDIVVPALVEVQALVAESSGAVSTTGGSTTSSRSGRKPRAKRRTRIVHRLWGRRKAV